MAAKRVTLELLERLSDEGKKVELQQAIKWCSTKQIRSLFAGLGVRVRSKEYEAYHTKAGYSELLTQMLAMKTASKNIPAAPLMVVTPTQKTRKTKNCNLRLVNVMFSDAMAPFIEHMNARPTQDEKEAGTVGGNNPFWTRLRAEFVSSKAEYAKVRFEDKCFSGFDLGNPVLHSSKKLRGLWGELCAAFTGASARFSSLDNRDEGFLACCLNRYDVYYLHRRLEVKPSLLWTTTGGKLPPNIQLRTIVQDQPISGSEDSDREHSEQTRSRERLNSDVGRLLGAFEPAARSSESSEDEQRAQLLQSIKDSCKALSSLRSSDPESELEHIIRHELERSSKRLKAIQQKDKREHPALV